MTTLVNKNNKKNKFWKFGLDSSSLLNQNLVDNYGKDYINRNLTSATFNNYIIKIPNFQYLNIQPNRSYGYPPYPNISKESTYYLIKPFKCGMIYVPPVYSYKYRNGKIIRN